jgi:type IV secretion system protein VirB10
MSADNAQEKLAATTSPNTVVMRKKRARTINNWPLIIALAVIGVILTALVGVVVSRSGGVESEAAEEGAAPATELARNVLGPAGGGVVEAPVPVVPEPPPVPQLPISPPEPAPPPERPALPAREREAEKPAIRENENARRIRELRFRQWEAALNSPIKVQHEEIKTSARNRSAELSEIDRQLAMLDGQEALSYEQRVAAAQGGSGSGGIGADYSGRNDLSRMQQFESGARDWTNPATVEAPATMHIIRTGSVIPSTLVSGINSDLPGQIIGQVSQNVYDTPTGKHLLIPQGSRLVGEYSSQVQYGQSRVFAVWQRIIYPDGKALDIGSSPGGSGAGYTGFRDRVNNHYVRIFGSAIMMSAILAGVEMTQNNSNNDSENTQRMSDALSESLGQVLGGVIGEMLGKNMSIAPTIEIRPGYRLNVMLVKDLVFPGPYRSFDYVSQ